MCNYGFPMDAIRIFVSSINDIKVWEWEVVEFHYDQRHSGKILFQESGQNKIWKKKKLMMVTFEKEDGSDKFKFSMTTLVSNIEYFGATKRW